MNRHGEFVLACGPFRHFYLHATCIIGNGVVINPAAC